MSTLSVTGDAPAKVSMLASDLNKIKYPAEDLNHDFLISGDVPSLLHILHYTLVEFSRPFVAFLLENGFDLLAKSDQRFIELVFKLMRDRFNYLPGLTSAQFLSNGYAERKLIFTIDVVRTCKRTHNELVAAAAKAKKKVHPERLAQLHAGNPGKQRDMSSPASISHAQSSSGARAKVAADGASPRDGGPSPRSLAPAPTPVTPVTKVHSECAHISAQHNMDTRGAKFGSEENEIDRKSTAWSSMESIPMHCQADPTSSINMYYNTAPKLSMEQQDSRNKAEAEQPSVQQPPQVVSDISVLTTVLKSIEELGSKFDRLESKVDKMNYKLIVLDGRVKFLENHGHPSNKHLTISPEK